MPPLRRRQRHQRQQPDIRGRHARRLGSVAQRALRNHRVLSRQPKRLRCQPDQRLGLRSTSSPTRSDAAETDGAERRGRHVIRCNHRRRRKRRRGRRIKRRRRSIGCAERHGRDRRAASQPELLHPARRRRPRRHHAVRAGRPGCRRQRLRRLQRLRRARRMRRGRRQGRVSPGVVRFAHQLPARQLLPGSEATRYPARSALSACRSAFPTIIAHRCPSPTRAPKASRSARSSEAKAKQRASCPVLANRATRAMRPPPSAAPKACSARSSTTSACVSATSAPT